MEVTPQPLSREAFTAFGDVIDIPDEAGRTYYDEALGNLRPSARASLSAILKAETAERPLRADLLERHQFSSQTFVPIDVGRWLIVVAPHAADYPSQPRRLLWIGIVFLLSLSVYSICRSLRDYLRQREH